MSWDEFPPWSRRKGRFPFFPGWSPWEVDDWMKEMDRWLEETIKDFSGSAPKTLVRERKAQDGSVVREIGPLVYGYSVTIGPEGKPIVREFGNMKPGFPQRRLGRAGLELKEQREPLVDIIPQDDELKVIAEVPGVEKKDLTLSATPNVLVIDASTAERKYYKEIELPSEVDPQTAKSNYNNGILEVKFKSAKKPPKGSRINVE